MLDSIRQNAQSWGVKAIFGVIILVFVFWGAGSFQGNQTQVLATVNETPIYLNEFSRAYQTRVEQLRQEQPNLTPEQLRQQDIKGQIFNELVNNIVIEQQLQELGISVSPAELRYEISKLPVFQSEDQSFDPARYERLLASQGLNPAAFEADMRQSIGVSKLQKYLSLPAGITESEARSLFEFSRNECSIEFILSAWSDYMDDIEPSEEAIAEYLENNREAFRVPKRIQIAYLRFTPSGLAPAMDVSEEAIQEFYEANAEEYFTQEEQVKARHLLIKVEDASSEEQVEEAKERILAAAERIESGEEFADVAKELSEGPTSVKGGDLGWFTRGQMVESFEEAAFSLQPGEMSEPVLTMFGWHLIKVEDREDTHQKPLDEVHDTIRSMLAEEMASEKLTDMLDTALEQVIAGSGLETIAASMNLDIMESQKVDSLRLRSRIGISEQGAEQLFAMPEGGVTDFPVSIDGGYMLAEIKVAEPSHIPELDEENLRGRIISRIQRREGMKIAKEEAEKLLTTILDSGVPEEYQERIIKGEPFARGEDIPLLGTNEQLANDAFNSPVGEWSDKTYEVNNGYAIFRTAELIPVDEDEWAETKGQWIQSMNSMSTNMLTQSYIASLRQDTEVELLNADVLSYD